MARVVYFLAVFLAASLRSYAQTDSTFLTRLTNSLNTSSKKNPVEKVHLQLDKAYYAAGDDVWFKAYITAGSKHELSDISGVLYVELINNRKEIEQYIKLPVANGLTWGDFKLPDTIKAGNYRIRAYTNWMRNAGPEYFYNKTIYIVNSIAPVPPPLSAHQQKKKIQQQINDKPVTAKVDLQFFPESGNLVYGTSSTVAFKGVGEDGLGRDVKGFITDDQNQQVTTFSSAHLGMAVFTMMPIEGHTYKACITYPDGAEKTIALPVPINKGFVLHIDNTDSLLLKIDIEASPDLVNKNEGVYLVAQSAGAVCFAAKSKSISFSFTAAIPKSKFPSGVVQFTLFSASGEPLNERLVFIHRNDQLNLSFTSPKSNNNVRGKKKFELTSTGDGKPAPGNFSVAVIDATTIPADENENTIFSNLLLTSDLKGYIEKPAYYFASDNAKTRQDLDVLMLTQGYRRFQWKQVLSGDVSPTIYKPESSLQITGHITTLSDRPLDHAKVSLMSSSKGFLMIDTISDKSGYFVFDNLQFGDSVKFVVQSKSPKNSKNVQIELDTIRPAAVIPMISAIPTKIDTPTGLAVLSDNSKKIYDHEIKFGIGNRMKVLKEVKITAAKKLPNSSNMNGPGNADQVILWKDLHGGCATIATCLMGRLMGVYFRYDLTNMVYFPVTQMDGKWVAMKIMIDGFLASAEQLDQLPPESIESVEVLKSSAFTSIYGNDGYHGLILVNTKKGGFNGKITPPNIATITPKGYYKAREFYSPKYDDPNTSTVLADLRSTIYWNPNLVTDKDGKVSFEYFNAGSKGSYRVVVEGIDSSGRLGRYVYNYKVD